MTRSGSATDRVLRTTALLFGVGAIVFGALTAPAIVSDAAAAPVWWTASGIVLVLGTSVALGGASLFAPVGVIRALAGAVAIGWLATATSVLLVLPRAETHDQSPWPLALTALGTTAAALAWRPRVAWAGIGVMGVLVFVDRSLTAVGDLTLVAVQDATYAMFFAAVFVALAIGALRAGRAVDAAAERASAAVIDAAVDRVRQDERIRVDSLVHDRVLATLLMAGRSLISTEIAARQADQALVGLRALADPANDPPSVAPDALADRLRAETTGIAPFAEVVAEIASDAPELPADVAEAVLGACGEALRNAVQHAGGDASILVSVRAHPGLVEVAVIDDGVGFDPVAVRSTRLGIRSSIVGRIRAVGGEADVRSQPGRGTAVQIRVGVDR